MPSERKFECLNYSKAVHFSASVANGLYHSIDIHIIIILCN